MDESRNLEESTLHSKRKPDLIVEDEGKKPEKVQKTDIIENDSSVLNERNDEKREVEKVSEDWLIAEGKIDGGEAAVEDGEDEEEDYEDEEDDNEDEDGEDDEVLNGKTVVDRKGKGVLMDNKGKGKLISEDDEDDSDDGSSDNLSLSDGDSDLSDDPLAEVDLDNILPTRTRRRAAQPGVSIAGDRSKDQQGR